MQEKNSVREERNLTTGTEAVALNKKKLAKRHFSVIFTIVIAAFLRAVALELFLLPNQIIVGGAIGIASTVGWMTGLTSFNGMFLLIVNVPLLIVASFKTDKNFVIKTAICVLLMAGFMEAIALTDVAHIVGTAPVSDETKVLFALLGGALCGISLPMTLNVQASTGGSDIITVILQKRKGIGNYSRVALYIDVVGILVCSVLAHLFGDGIDLMEILIYSISCQFVANVVQSHIHKGYSSAYGLDIITDKPQEVAQTLSDNLHRGMTGIKVTGMYSHQDKTMIVCVIYKRQLNRARQLVRQVDPNAFATVYTIKEVVGNGFRNTDEDIENKVLRH